MHFVQKALLNNRADFTFGEKTLQVTVDDGRLKVGFTVPYHEIGTKRSIKGLTERAVLRFGLTVLLAVIAGYYLMQEDLRENDSLILGVFALIGLILCIASRYASFDATRIPIASGHTILVFQDNQQQTILAEIYKRRKSEMLRLYGEVDALNHPQLEMKKFLWLKEEGVISEAEFESARQKIEPLLPAAPGHL